MTRPEDLPYGRTMARLLGPMHRWFLLLNRYVTGPALRSGLGPLLSTPATGSMLVLRTTGRTSGLLREAPLAYALVDGRIVVMAGYGRRCDWFRNALAHPEVEVVLPGARLGGVAAEITDPADRRVAFRAAIDALALVGTLTIGDLEKASPERLDELEEAFPMLAITPTAVLRGPFDPGGVATRWLPTAALAVQALVVARLVRRWRRP
jgi:deazaflavin-dependent oxidoreductase (nitroreductase family)